MSAKASIPTRSGRGTIVVDDGEHQQATRSWPRRTENWLSHTSRIFEVAERLREAGHGVVFADEGQYMRLPRDAGFRVVAVVAGAALRDLCAGSRGLRRLLVLLRRNEQDVWIRQNNYSLDLEAPDRWRSTGCYLNENKGFPIVVNHPAGGLGVLGGHTYARTEDGIADRPMATFEWLK